MDTGVVHVIQKINICKMKFSVDLKWEGAQACATTRWQHRQRLMNNISRVQRPKSAKTKILKHNHNVS